MLRLLLTVVIFLVSQHLVNPNEIFKSIDNQIIITLDNDYHVVQIQDDVFYAPLLAKVSTEVLETSKCYFNPFWNATVLPIRVDIWSTKYLQELSKQLEERKQASCSYIRKGEANLNGTMCSKNITVLPTPMTIVNLESEWSEFVSFKIDISYRRFSPRAVTFPVRIPVFTNCSYVKALFQESSFLNAIQLVTIINKETFSDVREPTTSLDDRINLSLTNQIIFEAINMSGDLSKVLNMSTVKYVREDYIQSISNMAAILLLKNVAMNFENAEKLRYSVYNFLCPMRESVTNTMKRVNVKTEAYPDATTTLLDGMSSMQYCRIPQIEWLYRYVAHGQVYNPRYGRHETNFIEMTNVRNYLSISLRRIQLPGIVRVPLTK